MSYFSIYYHVNDPTHSHSPCKRLHTDKEMDNGIIILHLAKGNAGG